MVNIPNPAEKLNIKYTFKDYLTWDDGNRWEIIEGAPYCMSLAPTWKHQKVSGELFRQIANYLTGKSCLIFVAPFDVLLPAGDENNDDVQTVVQPDLAVICERAILKDIGYIGAPDLIIEVVSPTSGKMDRVIKFNLYEKAGVKEYWLVQPEEKVLTVFQLGANQKYGRPESYSDEGLVKTAIFLDLTLDLKMIFAE